jgi:hypothetical protein
LNQPEAHPRRTNGHSTHAVTTDRSRTEVVATGLPCPQFDRAAHGPTSLPFRYHPTCTHLFAALILAAVEQVKVKPLSPSHSHLALLCSSHRAVVLSSSPHHTNHHAGHRSSHRESPTSPPRAVHRHQATGRQASPQSMLMSFAIHLFEHTHMDSPPLSTSDPTVASKTTARVPQCRSTSPPAPSTSSPAGQRRLPTARLRHHGGPPQ